MVNWLLVAPAEAAGIYSQLTGIFTDEEFLKQLPSKCKNPILDDSQKFFVEFEVYAVQSRIYMKEIWSL